MSLIPTTNQDAHRSQLVSRFFHLVGDVMQGTDAEPRFEPGMTGGGLLGPAQHGADMGFDLDGQAFFRGRAGATASAAPPAAPSLFGVPLTLPVLLLIAGAAYLLLRK
jgi:hypothetical protein